MTANAPNSEIFVSYLDLLLSKKTLLFNVCFSELNQSEKSQRSESNIDVLQSGVLTVRGHTIRGS